MSHFNCDAALAAACLGIVGLVGMLWHRMVKLVAADEAIRRMDYETRHLASRMVVLGEKYVAEQDRANRLEAALAQVRDGLDDLFTKRGKRLGKVAQ